MSSGRQKDRDTERVAVVDDRHWVAEALVALLHEHDVPAEGIDPADLPNGLVGDGVALVSLPEEQITEVVASLKGRGWRVVAYGCADDIAAALALEAGAVGVVEEAAAAEELVATVRRVRNGLPVVEPAHRDRLLRALRIARSRQDPAAFRLLTGREREVLSALIDGQRSKDIASTDFVSVTTVRNQIQSILTKLNVNSQLEAVALARRVGWPNDQAWSGFASGVGSRRR